jgi:Domain of unknown function (DUF4124)
MKRLIPFILFAVFCLCTSLEADEIYQWIDQNGVTHFTNEPPPAGAKIVKQQQAIPYDEAAAEKNQQQVQELLDQESEQQQSQADQQTGSPQEAQAAPEVQAGESDADSDTVVQGVIADPYVRNRELRRDRYERRNREDEEIVTPLPRRNRMPERMR